MGENAWMLRPNIDSKKFEKLDERDLVACGWPHLGDLSGLSKDEIKILLQRPPYEYTKIKLGNVSSALDIFVNQMELYDRILMPSGKYIRIGYIISEYIYDSTVDNDMEGYPHQRKIEWIKTIEREKLPIELRQALKAQQVATSLARFYDIICLMLEWYEDQYFEDSKYLRVDNSLKSVKVEYPLRPNYTVSFTVPIDISRFEAKRLASFCGTLSFGHSEYRRLELELGSMRGLIMFSCAESKFSKEEEARLLKRIKEYEEELERLKELY